MPWTSTSRQVRVAASLLLVIVTVLGILTLFYSVNANNAINALHTSSARNECRAQVVNDAEDLFRHQVGELLDAATRRDAAAVAAIALQIRRADDLNAQIDRRCPKPLVDARPSRP